MQKALVPDLHQPLRVDGVFWLRYWCGAVRIEPWEGSRWYGRAGCSGLWVLSCLGGRRCH